MRSPNHGIGHRMIMTMVLIAAFALLMEFALSSEPAKF
jgi:hypothetical protein